MQDSSDSDSDSDDSDDSDDEDVPLHLLLQSSAKRTATKQNNSPPSKRTKQQTEDKQTVNKKAVPSPYFLAQILKIISERHGHVYTEPSHAEFAW